MASLTIARSGATEFGLNYNESNGRASAIYCLGPWGVRGTVILDDDSVISGALAAGQQVPVPGNRVQVALSAEGGMDIIGVRCLQFEFVR